MKLRLALALLTLMLMAVVSPRVAHADLGYWSAALVGTWKHPRNGDVYRFNSDATYTFTAGPAKRKAGDVSHRGWWKIAQPTKAESGGPHGPVALIIKVRRQTIMTDLGKPVELPPKFAKRDFRLVVNTVLVDGKGYVDNLYQIDGVNWKRAK